MLANHLTCTEAHKWWAAFYEVWDRTECTWSVMDAL